MKQKVAEVQPEAEEESKEDPHSHEEQIQVIHDKELYRRYVIFGEWGLRQDGKDFNIKCTEIDEDELIRITVDDRCYNSG